MYMVLLLRDFRNQAYLGWITYATAGVMQGTLLVMCLAWKARQARLGIDDFGKPLGFDVSTVTVTSIEPDASGGDEVHSQDQNVINEHTPLLRKQGTGRC